jgi:hypothetical protein
MCYVTWSYAGGRPLTPPLIKSMRNDPKSFENLRKYKLLKSIVLYERKEYEYSRSQQHRVSRSTTYTRHNSDLQNEALQSPCRYHLSLNNRGRRSDRVWRLSGGMRLCRDGLLCCWRRNLGGYRWSDGPCYDCSLQQRIRSLFCCLCSNGSDRSYTMIFEVGGSHWEGYLPSGICESTILFYFPGGISAIRRDGRIRTGRNANNGGNAWVNADLKSIRLSAG